MKEIKENPNFSTKLFPVPQSGNFSSKDDYLKNNYYLLREGEFKNLLNSLKLSF